MYINGVGFFSWFFLGNFKFIFISLYVIHQLTSIWKNLQIHIPIQRDSIPERSAHIKKVLWCYGLTRIAWTQGLSEWKITANRYQSETFEYDQMDSFETSTKYKFALCYELSLRVSIFVDKLKFTRMPFRCLEVIPPRWTGFNKYSRVSSSPPPPPILILE